MNPVLLMLLAGGAAFLLLRNSTASSSATKPPPLRLSWEGTHGRSHNVLGATTKHGEDLVLVPGQYVEVELPRGNSGSTGYHWIVMSTNVLVERVERVEDKTVVFGFTVPDVDHLFVRFAYVSPGRERQIALIFDAHFNRPAASPAPTEPKPSTDPATVKLTTDEALDGAKTVYVPFAKNGTVDVIVPEPNGVPWAPVDSEGLLVLRRDEAPSSGWPLKRLTIPLGASPRKIQFALLTPGGDLDTSPGFSVESKLGGEE